MQRKEILKMSASSFCMPIMMQDFQTKYRWEKEWQNRNEVVS